MAAELSDVVPSTQKTSDAAASPIDLTEPFMLGDWLIEPALRRASTGDTVVKIDPRNLRVLQILAERQGALVSQREIEALAWEGVVVTADSLYQSIRQLRQALRDTKAPAKYIETVPRRGYRLVAPVMAIKACSSVTISEDCDDEATLRGPPDAGINLPVLSRQPRPHTPRYFVIVLACCFLSSLIGFYWLHLASDDVAGTRGSGNASSKDRTQPTMDVRELLSAGEMALNRGRPREALALIERALTMQREIAGEQNELFISALVDMANAHIWLDDESAARSEATQALSLLNRLAPASSPDRIRTLRVLADVLVCSGEYEEAERLLDDSLALSQKYYGKGHFANFGALAVQVALRFAQQRFSEGESIARDMLEIATRSRGASSLSVAHSRVLLGASLVELGRPEEGEREASLAIDLLKRKQKSQHPYSTSAMHVLAEALVKQGRLAEAETILLAVLQGLRSERAAKWRTGRAANTMGELYLLQGRTADAAQSLDLAQQALTRRTGFPIELERRKLEARLQRLNTLRSSPSRLAKLHVQR